MSQLEEKISLDEFSKKLSETGDIVSSLRQKARMANRPITCYQDIEAIVALISQPLEKFPSIYPEYMDNEIKRANHFISEDDFDYV